MHLNVSSSVKKCQPVHCVILCLKFFRLESVAQAIDTTHKGKLKGTILQTSAFA